MRKGNTAFDWLVLGFILGAIAVAFVSSARAADAPAGCTPANGAIGKFLSDERTARAVSLEGEQLKRAVNFFNALPPTTNEAFDLGAIFETKQGTGILLLGSNGNFCQGLAVGDPDKWAIIVRYVLGTEPNAASQR